MSLMEVTVALSGPLFEASAPARVQVALEEAVSELTDLGEQRLISAFPQGLPVKTGFLRSQVTPVKYGARAELNDGGVIYSAFIEGTSSRNESTRFRGYSTWRRAFQYLQDEAAPQVASKAGEKLARELGG